MKAYVVFVDGKVGQAHFLRFFFHFFPLFPLFIINTKYGLCFYVVILGATGSFRHYHETLPILKESATWH